MIFLPEPRRPDRPLKPDNPIPHPDWDMEEEEDDFD